MVNIGQTYRYSSEYAFYIFSQQIHLIIFLDFLSPSSFIPPQNVVYFLMLPFLVHKIFTFYINGVLNCKCPAPGPKCLIDKGCRLCVTPSKTSGIKSRVICVIAIKRRILTLVSYCDVPDPLVA